MSPNSTRPRGLPEFGDTARRATGGSAANAAASGTAARRLICSRIARSARVSPPLACYTAAVLHPGLRLRSGRYRLLSRVRAGATAQVWRALDTRDGVEVAIKAVPADAGGAVAVEHEAEAVARVQHPGAVRVHATFEEAGHGLIVMELAACSLADHVEAHGSLDGPTARGIALALAEVLAAAHAAGVVHRDVKPQNVLILPDCTVRLADFGIARVHAQGHTRTQALLGTLPFMAPEQRRDARDVRPATDVYALAALIAWMRTGAPPGDLFVPEVVDLLRGRLRAAREPDDALLDLIPSYSRSGEGSDFGVAT